MRKLEKLRSYDRSELLSRISKLSITRTGNTISTMYGGNVIATDDVSSRYEVFDIVNYIREKIEQIEKNFEIKKYRMGISGGIQYLELVSDEVDLGNDRVFYKTFYILNSTNRTRKLSFSMGLKSREENYSFIMNNNMSLTKRHLTGIVDIANKKSEAIEGELFEEQIQYIKRLDNHKVKFSNLRDTILMGDRAEDGSIPDINHKKFDILKRRMNFSFLSNEHLLMLSTPSEKMIEVPKEMDFYIDAYWAFSNYLSIFGREDSHIVKRESAKIMKITLYNIRKEKLSSILSL
jgi:hypothetical protein